MRTWKQAEPCTISYEQQHSPIRFRLHRRGFRLRRQRERSAAQRERLPRRGDGDGAPLDSREPAANELVTASLVLAAQPGVARLLQHAIFPPRHHPAWLRGGRRLHHLRLHHAASAGQSVGRGLVEGPGRLEAGDAAALRHCVAHAGRDREPHSWAVGQVVATRGRRNRDRRYLLSHQRGDPAVARRRAGRNDDARSILRRRRSGAHHVQRLRRLHDGLPSRREEHARFELSLSGGEARRADFRGDESRGRSPARGKGRWQRRLRSSHRRLSRSFQSTPPPLHLSRSGVLSLVARNDGVAVQLEG